MPGVQVEQATNGATVAPLKAQFNNQAFVHLKNVKSKLLIDGEWVDSSSGKTFKVFDPRTEEVIFECADANAHDVDVAVHAARRAFDEGPWPRMGGGARGKVLYKLAELVEKHADELAALESLDNGKPYAIARAADIPLVAEHLRYYAGFADKITGNTIPTDKWFGDDHFAYTLHEPIGVVGCVIPWNFPALMMAWKIAPALCCGNTIVIKPAEQTPLTALRIGELALEAGLPKGVLNIITGFGPTAGAPIVEHPKVDKVAFTGSTEVGRIIMKTCAEHIKDVSLELGGKSALIVWKDADLDEAVQLAHFALFFNHGQCCAAGSRLYVHADIYDAFVQRAGEMAAKRKVGDPFDADVEQGPQVDNDQFNKIMSYIEAGKQEGARLVTGGRRCGDRGYFVEPTVFADVQDDMKIAREEIFGPVQSILKFHSLEEVIKRANDSEYGLAAGVISNDINVINRISRSLKSGTVWVNTYNTFQNSVPFGGYRMSGLSSRDKGEYALHNFTATKCIITKLKGEQDWI